MKTKLLLIPLIFILLVSSVIGFTYDSTLNFNDYTSCSVSTSECTIGGSGQLDEDINFIFMSKKTTGTPIPARIWFFDDDGVILSNVTTSNVDSYNIYGGASDQTFLYALTQESGSYIRKFYQNGTQIFKKSLSGSYQDITYSNNAFYLLKSDGEIDVYDTSFSTLQKTLSPSLSSSSFSGLTLFTDFTLLLYSRVDETAYEIFISDGSYVNEYSLSNTTTLSRAGTISEDTFAFSTLNIFERSLFFYTTTEGYDSDYYVDGNTYYDTSAYCISSFQLCNDTNFLYSTTNPSCNSITAVTDCSGGCTNSQTTIDVVTYKSGNCVVSEDCSNECNIEGETWCYTDLTYRTCYRDSDGCLKYSSPVTCDFGEVCSVDVTGAECKLYNYSDFTNFVIPPLWNVELKQNDTGNNVFTPTDKVGSRIRILGRLLFLNGDDFDAFIKDRMVVGYDVQTSYSILNYYYKITLPQLTQDERTYVAVDCNYKETEVVEEYTTQTGIESKTIAFSETNDNLKFEVFFNPCSCGTDDEVTTYLYLRNLDEIGVNITFYMNDTYLIIYENDEVMLDILHPSGYEDVAGIYTYCDVSPDTQFFSCKYQIERVNTPTETYYGSPKPLYDMTPTFFSSFTMTMDSNKPPEDDNTFSFYQFQLSKLPNKKGFVFNNQELFQHSCIAETTGCKVVRFYHSYLDMPFYTDFKDQLICVNSLSDANPTNTKGLDDFGSNISPLWKYIITILSFVVIVGISLTFGIMTDLLGVGVVFAGVMGVATLLFFSLIGFISTLFVVLMIVFGALLSSLFLVKRMA